MQGAVNCLAALSKAWFNKLEMRPQARRFLGNRARASILFTPLTELNSNATAVSLVPFSATVAQRLPFFIECAKNRDLCLLNVNDTINSRLCNTIVVGKGGGDDNGSCFSFMRMPAELLLSVDAADAVVTTPGLALKLLFVHMQKGKSHCQAHSRSSVFAHSCLFLSCRDVSAAHFGENVVASILLQSASLSVCWLLCQ